ncbi:membrane-bound transcription factor site-2 protease [Drosophila rhopaloa]|uniref:Membrane-bound transcription factor site-2 protease n=1 Tax=Drosophila rhopaloa TaxID=1041015 RepID=A0A6P4F611_DRORH|nr:membrane-bound transcription factor site-2 protease [Drosophila rhopaloa]
MDPLVFLIVLALIYGVLYFFDRFFKSCMHYPYDAFLKNTGLSVNFMSLHWHTSAFNRTLLRWGSAGNSCTRRVLLTSFNIGVLVTFSLLPIGLILLITTIFSNGEQDSSSSPVGVPVQLEILLPGVNLPLEEIGYYITTLVLCLVVHEMGHALAAVMEDVPVTGFGIKFIYCLPFAYTELSHDHLNSLRWFRKLRVLCAGIWHNVVFAGVCYLLISTVGITMSPLYAYNQHVVVTELTRKSPLRGERGLQVDNQITQVNGCPVNSEESWMACLQSSLKLKPGYCVSADFVQLNDESSAISHHSIDGQLQCCDELNPNVSCFEVVEDANGDVPVELPQHVCLNVRRTLEEVTEHCSSGVCNEGFCLRPLIRNTTAIMTFKRQNSLGEKLSPVIYVGYPWDVTRTVDVSAFVPRYSFLKAAWPDAWLLLLKYNVVFSIGLALINAIPCFGFDGAHITSTVIHSFLVGRVDQHAKRDLISVIITSVGSLLFGLALLKVAWLSFLRPLL